MHNNIQVVDSSLKGQEMMVVIFSKSEQKKKRQKKRKEKKTTKNKEAQTNKQRKGTISEEDNFIGWKETGNAVVVSRQKLVAMTYSILKVVFDGFFYAF